ncbi:MAG: nuclease, partial [Pyrinomonadaceae bacterium]
VTLLPGQHFLLQLASAGGNGASLPTPDSASGIALSAAGGKVVLAFNNILMPAGPICPAGPALVDFVGYGTANCSEGASRAPAPAITSAALRNGNGCTG